MPMIWLMDTASIDQPVKFAVVLAKGAKIAGAAGAVVRCDKSADMPVIA